MPRCSDARGNQAIGRGGTLTRARWPTPFPPQRYIAGTWPSSTAPPLFPSLLDVLDPSAAKGWGAIPTVGRPDSGSGRLVRTINECSEQALALEPQLPSGYG